MAFSKNLRKDIVESIARYQLGKGSKEDILRSARELELSIRPESLKVECAAGKWSLIFSTMTSSRDDQTFAQTFIDDWQDKVYKQIFRIAPFLAGSQQTSIASEKRLVVRNEQTINLERLAVNNAVTIGIKPIGTVQITVDGEIEIVDRMTLNVIFTSCTIQGIRLPLPRPQGRLTTTYCDDDLRISRGGKGGIFIVKRIK